jgi:hypothetical protein
MIKQSHHPMFNSWARPPAKLPLSNHMRCQTTTLSLKLTSSHMPYLRSRKDVTSCNSPLKIASCPVPCLSILGSQQHQPHSQIFSAHQGEVRSANVKTRRGVLFVSAVSLCAFHPKHIPPRDCCCLLNTLLSPAKRFILRVHENRKILSLTRRSSNRRRGYNSV